MQGGQFYEETKNEYGVAAPGTALLAGAAAGVLDVLGLEIMLKRFLPKEIPQKAAAAVVNQTVAQLARSKVTGVAKAIAGGAALGVVTEAPPELVQEVIGVLHKEWFNPDQSVPLADRMLSPEYKMRYLEAAVAGGLFGGAFGGLGGAVSKLGERAAKPAAPATPAPATPAPATPAPATPAPATPAPATPAPLPTGCDSGPCDSGPCDSGPCDSGPCDSGPCDSGPCDSGPC